MASRCVTWVSVGMLCLVSVSKSVASEESCEYEARAPSVSSALAFLERHATEAEQELLELAAFPSISSMADYHTYVLDAGKWLVKRLRRAGMKVWVTGHSCQTSCTHCDDPTVLHGVCPCP